MRAKFSRYIIQRHKAKVTTLFRYFSPETYREAVNMNMGGTVRVLELAREVRDLISMVHISTAYTNCTRNEAEEEIYE